MRDIRHIPLISRTEERSLGQRSLGGDKDAQQQLISANLRLVVKIAHDFRGLGLGLSDLVAEGNLGLMRAAERFDPDKGARFSSYAAWWIKQRMRRAITEKAKTVRVPSTSMTRILKIRRFRHKFWEEHQREPTDQEVAGELEFSARVVNRLRRADRQTVSLQDPVLRGESDELQKLIPDDSKISPFRILDASETDERTEYLLDCLDEREQRIITLRYGLRGERPHTLEEISKAFGRTRERVRQIQKKALKKLRQRLFETDNYSC
jgi:RNA polymerase primary sigma factor